MTVKVKCIQPETSQTEENMEPHWIAVIDYSGREVTIPIPARLLPGGTYNQQLDEAVEAMERLAHALLDFAARSRSWRSKSKSKS